MIKNTSQLTPIYLDANASLPALPEARAALLSALSMQGNASSTHVLGRRLRARLDEAREHVAAALLGAEKELFFCSGASEGNRWLVDALVLSGQLRGKPYRVIVSPFEHPSLMKCLLAKAELGLIILEIIKISEGKLETRTSVFAGADAVIMTAAHNETGYVPDFCSLITALDNETILISDAAQAVARLDALPKRVDVIIASAHKMGGVVGAGAVLLRGRARALSAPWAGGGQEAGLRPGSESVPLIAAMGEAAKHINLMRKRHQDLATLRDEIETELLQAWPFAFVVGNAAQRLPQTSAICLNGVNGEALRIAIDQGGVCVGFGSACSALAPEPSPSFLALGLTPEQARATIRISLSPDLSRDDAMHGIERLRLAVANIVDARQPV